MGEIMVAIQDLLRRHMNPKSADTVICVITGSILIGATTGLIVPLCISTLACKIIYGIIVGIIVIGIIAFIIHIWLSKKYDSSSSPQDNEPAQRSNADESDGHPLMNQGENASTSRTNNANQQEERTSIRETTTSIGARVRAADNLDAECENINIKSKTNADIIGVDVEAENNAKLKAKDITVE